MKFKRTIAKWFACFMIFTFVVSVPISAMAASYTTTTTYDVATQKVTVTSQISQVAEGEDITYLVYSGDVAQLAANPTRIKYIDQYLVPTGVTTKMFQFSTTDKDIGGATVNFGTSSLLNIPAPATTPDASLGVFIKVKTVIQTPPPGGNFKVPTGIVTAAGLSSIDQAIQSSSGAYLYMRADETKTFDFTTDYGTKVLSVEDTTGATPVPLTFTPTAFSVATPSTNKQITVTFAAKTGEESTIGGITLNGALPSELGNDTSSTTNRYVTTLGTLNTARTDIEYGILFTKIDNTDPKYNDTDVQHYPALAMGSKYAAIMNGKFAIRLNDSTGNILKGTWRTRTYLKLGTGVTAVYIYGSVVDSSAQ